MATLIQIRRGSSSTLPVLADGEFGWCEDTKQLWLGSATGVNILVSGGSSSGSVYITNVTPVGGNISSLSQTIVVTFSDAMNATTDTTSNAWSSSIANPINWVLSSPSGTVRILSVTATPTTATITTQGSAVNSGDQISLTPTPNIQSASGVPLSSASIQTYSYTYIAPSSNPTILGWSPVGGNLTTVPSQVVITFSSAMNTAANNTIVGWDNSIANPANYSIQSTSSNVGITVGSFTSTSVTLNLSAPSIASGASIAIIALTSLQDSNGNALAGANSVQYTYNAPVSPGGTQTGASGGTTSGTTGGTAGGTTTTGGTTTNPPPTPTNDGTGGTAGSTATSGPGLYASQEGGRKPAINYSLNLANTLTRDACKNEIIGNVLQVTTAQNLSLGATNLPAGVTLNWFKLVPVQSRTASIAGGPVGTMYDPCVPIGTTYVVTTPGSQETAWLWVDISVASTVTPGNYTFNLTAGPYSVAVTLTVWNFTIPATPVMPMYMKLNSQYVVAEILGKSSDPSQPVLTALFSQMANAHRFELFAQNDIWPTLGSGDPTQGLNLDTPASDFNTRYRPYRIGTAAYLPLHSTITGTGSTAPYWGQQFTGANYAKAWHYTLKQAANADMRTNNWCYFLDEPGFSGNSALTNQIISELTTIKSSVAEPFLPKIMITYELTSGFQGVSINGTPTNLIDIYCVIQSFLNQSGHSRTSDYAAAGVTLWTYGGCMSHSCSGGGNGDGSPDLMEDQDSYHCVAYPIVSLALGGKGTLYYGSIEGWGTYDMGTLGDSTDIWKPGGIYTSGYGGNGDGCLFWPGRVGQLGLTSNQPIASIRMKNLREGLYLCDMIVAASKDGTDLVADGLSWRQKYKDYMDYHAALGSLLSGGAFTPALPAAAPGEFYVQRCAASAGTTSVTVLPPQNRIAYPTSMELWCGTTPGVYNTKCSATPSGSTITRGSTVTLTHTGGTPGTKYYYRVKAINAAGSYQWSKTEPSATFLAANTTGPIAISGLALWFAADMGVTADSSGNVSEWDDQSTTGYNLTQGTLAHQPLKVANAYKLLPTIRFAGSGSAGTSVSTWQGLFGPNTALNPTIAQMTVFLVHNPISSVTQMVPIANGLVANHFTMFVNRNGKAFSAPNFNTGYTDSVQAAASSGLLLEAFSSTDTGNSLKMYWDGVLDFSTTNGFVSPKIEYFRVGCGSPTGAGNALDPPNLYWYSGDICEVIVYNRVLTSAEMNNVTTYLKGKWGIS